MKKLLFVINNMYCGGVQTSLVNLLNEIKDEYEIDLVMFAHKGPLISDIPSQINIIPEDKRLFLLGEYQSKVAEKSKLQSLIRAAFCLLSRIVGGTAAHRLFFTGLKNKKKYDAAVSYIQDIDDKTFAVGCNDYVRFCVNADKKISFVHCDFERYGGNTAGNRMRYGSFDYIACVSESCKRVFDKCCPQYQNKTVVVRNCTDIQKIHRLADTDTIKYDGTYLNVVTTARLTEEKGIPKALELFERLINEDKLNIRWYIIGDGPLKEDIISKINAGGLNEKVFTEGEQTNPYKYMKNADVFLLPSFHECAPMVFDESKVLGLPVITTNTLSAREIIGDKYGVVCESYEEIYTALKELCKNDKKFFEGEIQQYYGENTLIVSNLRSLI